MKRDIETGKIHFSDKTLYVVSQGFTLCTGAITGLASISLFVTLGVPQALGLLNWTFLLCTTSGIMYFISPVHDKNKLIKQVKITDFIVNYRNAATKIIREEVNKRRKPLNYQNLVIPYPKESPYSEELYQRGLDLTIIDELSIKQQKQLRKLVKRRIGQ